MPHRSSSPAPLTSRSRRREAQIALGALPVFALDAAVAPVSLTGLYALPLLVAGLGFSRTSIVRIGAILIGLAIVGEIVAAPRRFESAPWLSFGVGAAVILAIVVRAWIRAPRDGKAEHALGDLQRSDNAYSTLFDTIGAPIWVADGAALYEAGQAARRQGVNDLEEWLINSGRDAAPVAAMARIIAANEAAARLFGVPRDALLRDGLGRFRTADGHRSLARLFAELMDGAAVAEVEVRFVNAAGAPIDVIVRASLPPDHGGWKRMFVMALDVTERHADQARLARAQSDLARASRITTLGQLTASIAHEVLQPLTAILSYGRSGGLWLAQEAVDAPETRNCLDLIVENGRRAAEILDRIRDMAGGAAPQFGPVDAAEIIEHTLLLVRRELESRDVDLSLAIAPDLPALMGDSIQIQQVIVNLIMNAIQAMSGSQERRLTVSAHEAADGVIIEVSDTGPGFGRADAEASFDPLFTTKAGGMGMGLAICRSIMANHGGTVQANDAACGGARLSLHFPAPRCVAAA